jgi:hypothetical protein
MKVIISNDYYLFCSTVIMSNHRKSRHFLHFFLLLLLISKKHLTHTWSYVVWYVESNRAVRICIRHREVVLYILQRYLCLGSCSSTRGTIRKIGWLCFKLFSGTRLFWFPRGVQHMPGVSVVCDVSQITILALKTRHYSRYYGYSSCLLCWRWFFFSNFLNDHLQRWWLRICGWQT